MIGRLRDTYGESPWHLAGHLLIFAGTGYAVVQLAGAGEAVNVFAWLIGAALIHDLVFLPAYGLLDRLGRRVVPRPRVPMINHVRFVVLVSGALLLVYFPLILARSPGNYRRATGHEPGDYGTRWLAITAGLVLVSAVAYALRVLRARRVEELHDPVDAAGDVDPSGP